MTINQIMRALATRSAQLRKHNGMSRCGTNPRLQPDTGTVPLQPCRTCQQILPMNGLRRNTRIAKILAQLTHKTPFVLTQIIEDLLHDGRLKQNPAQQGIAKAPIN